MPRIITTITIEYEQGDIFNMSKDEQKALVLAHIDLATLQRIIASDLFAYELLLQRTDDILMLPPIELF